MVITISKDCSHEIEIKKSRFICQLKRVKSEDEARDFISAVKKQHYKANHNCSAFVLGNKQEIQRTSDDGEPSGTAGVPMLEVLKKREITDVCAVVTRYFGGVKLGAGGLIRAYAGAVAQALDEVGLVEIVEQRELILTMEYKFFDGLANFLPVPVSEQNFSENVEVKIFLDETRIEQFKEDLTEKFNGKIAVETGGRQLVEVPVK
ncbi:YigZ family protein [Lactovum odontotermitis]